MENNGTTPKVNSEDANNAIHTGWMKSPVQPLQI